jgi:hypothetical protein
MICSPVRATDSALENRLGNNQLRQPSQNGTDEGFNERLRDECLNLERFRGRREARAIIETSP